LWDIAKKYNTSVDELIALNPKSKNVIFPGD
jgi:LysM repeat protein